MLAQLAAVVVSVTPFAYVEGGVALVGYNDVRVPNDGGSTISLTKDVGIPPDGYFRAQAGVELGRHSVQLTWAPLQLEGEGVLPSTVSFAGATFDGGTNARAIYQFDSYRLTYRYGIVRGKRWEVDLGLTAFLRDAQISLDGVPGGVQDSTDTGFVPLLSFRVAWWPTERLGVVLDGDAIAGSPYGRAEDVLLAVQWRVKPGIVARLGYRIVEGGADVDQVYNFALVNLVALGLLVSM
jgi:hypothetical protein